MEKGVDRDEGREEIKTGVTAGTLTQQCNDFFKKLISILKAEEVEGEQAQLLVHFSNAYNSSGWRRLKSGAQIQTESPK